MPTRLTPDWKHIYLLLLNKLDDAYETLHIEDDPMVAVNFVLEDLQEFITAVNNGDIL